MNKILCTLMAFGCAGCLGILSVLGAESETAKNADNKIVAVNNPAVSDTNKSEKIPTVAVLPFECRSPRLESSIGKSIAELLSINLLEKANMELVERAELEKAVDELNISATGLVDKGSQNRLGRLVGAKILVTGSVFESEDKTFLVAKVIGTESSRVLGCSVSALGDPVNMVPELSAKIDKIISESKAKLIPGELNEVDVVKALNFSGNGRRVYIKVSENINVEAVDPAVETELERIVLALGFEVVQVQNEADFRIVGEAFAVQGNNYSKFISANGRVELKIYDKANRLLASGSARETMAGASYQTTAKDALTQATLRLAEEVLPVMKENVTK
ncbi:MAG: CsgG/HfaB family protein [Victivallaceae bacterium]